jgi:hypothetical protein
MLKSWFIIIPFVISFGNIYSQQNNFINIPYRYNKLWGYCDTLGNILIAPKYDSVLPGYPGDFLYVYKGKKQSMLDANGKLLIASFDTCGHFGERNGLQYLSKEVYNFWVINNGKAGVINTKGDTVVPLIYDKLYYTRDYNLRKTTVVGKLDDTYYLISFSDKEMVKTTSPSYNALTVWELDLDTPPDLEKIDLAYGFLEMDHMLDSVKLKFQFDSMVKISSSDFQYDEGEFPFYKVYKGKKVGLWNKDHYIAPQYDDIVRFNPLNKSIIVRRGAKYGAADSQGKLILPCVYDEIRHYSPWSSVFITRVADKYGARVPGSFYPKIKDQYENLTLSYTIDVSKDRFFHVFKVRKNGNDGYVGENGSEYFKD